MNRITRFVYDEWQWILLYIMIGVVMYWTSIVVQPTLDILESQKNEIKLGTTQQQELIENQDNNTALLVELFERQNKLLSNQIVLVSKLTNATQTLNQSDANIKSHVETIVGQSNEVRQLVSSFRENFGFLGNETIERFASQEILANVTKIGNAIRELINEVEILQDIERNATD